MAKEYVLYSDGGAELHVSAAGACIVEDKETKERVYITSFLGPGTNNEGEIIGGLLGFSYLRAIGVKPEATKIHWICDSEYVLKSATGYIFNWVKNGWKTASRKQVKNKGLWKAYLTLAKGFSITPEHVRGHTGHPENEACDEACNWARAEGPDLLASGGEGDKFEINGEQWVLIDGAKTLEALREDCDDEEAYTAFIEKLTNS